MSEAQPRPNAGFRRVLGVVVVAGALAGLFVFGILRDPTRRDDIPSALLGKPTPAFTMPLFDRYRLTAGLESHDHVLKRTHPIRGGAIVGEGEGTLYVGGGMWGKGHPEVPEAHDYLAHTLARRHFWRVDLGGGEVRYTAIGVRVMNRAVERQFMPTDHTIWLHNPAAFALADECAQT